MLAAKLAHLSSVGCSSMLFKPVHVKLASQVSKLPCLTIRAANVTTRTGRTTLGKLRSKTVKETIMAPAGDTAFTMGKGLLAGASLVGIGSLCFYGLGLSNQVGAIDRAALWPDLVKHRIRDTYMYFGGALAFTAATAVAIARSPATMKIVSGGGMMSLFATLAMMMGTGYICRSLPYKEGFGSKQIAWMLHSAVLGAVIAPLTMLGGPIMLRAACYTAGVVGGLSTLAMCAPSEKFLKMGGPLAMGLGVVFMSSIGTWFLPPSTALGAGMMSIAMYGGLVLFGMFLLYDTQKIIKNAEHHPVDRMNPYDPVNNSIGIYMDTVNIFIRIAMMLSGSGKKRK